MVRQVCRLLVCLGLVSAMLGTALPASADPPDQGQWDSAGSDYFPIELCGFEVRVDWTETGHWVVYSRNELGEPTAWKVNYSGHYSWTNLSNGKVVLGHAAESWRGEWPIIDERGLVMSLRIPNSGVISIEVGRIVYDITDYSLVLEHGSHPLFPVGAGPILCEQLR